MRWWPWRRKTVPDNLVSISDPTAAFLFGGGQHNYSGVTLSETGLLGLSGMYRAISLLSGQIGMLPLRTYTDTPDERIPGKSVFDNPAGPGPGGQTRFEWLRDLVCYHKIHGNAFSFKLRNAAGAVVGYQHLHPLCVRMVDPTPEEIKSGKGPVGPLWYDVMLEDGTMPRYDATDIMHIPGLGVDGKRGLSLVQLAANSLGTAIAGDRAAAKVFSSGAMMAGIVSPDGEVDGFDATAVMRELRPTATGYENAGGLVAVNRALKFTPWTMTMQDAQFLQGRQFSIEEISRWTGVPPHLLMQTEKQTSWGTGVTEQNQALSRTVLGPDTTLYAQRFSRELNPTARLVEFDFTALERPTPEREIELLISQWDADLLTLNEVRKARNLPPLPGGDVVKTRWEAGVAQPAAV
jgi:HK97 family phage portal protein